MADYFKPPPKTSMAHIRMPEVLKEHLKGVVDLWKTKAVAKGIDPDDIDLTYVIVRLLEEGVDGTWAQEAEAAGLKGMPTTKEERERLLAAIVASAKPSKKPR